MKEADKIKKLLESITEAPESSSNTRLSSALDEMYSGWMHFRSAADAAGISREEIQNLDEKISAIFEQISIKYLD